MKPRIFCTKCKIVLEEKNQKLFCNNCGESFSNNNGYVDFLQGKNFDIEDTTKEKLKELLQKIKQEGYGKASLYFSNDPSITSRLLDVKSADSIFHGLGKNNLRCLEICSDLGKITENLSHIFHEVYSIETTNEKIEFQQKRFKYLERSNIILLSCNPINLPFPDNYFDLIVCNGILELSKIFDSDSKAPQNKFLIEMKRVLVEKGCLCLGVQNKFGLPQLFGSTKTNDVHGKKKSQCMHSLSGYQKLLKDTGFYSKEYWALPSYKKPYFTGNLDNEISLQWYFQNITRFLLKEKSSKMKNLTLSLIKKLNIKTISVITKIFVPSFIFCCYKNSNVESIENFIIQETKINNFVTVGRRKRLINIMLDRKGNPKKIISIERYGLDIPKKIIECERIFPNMKNPENRIWMEDWIKGEQLDPSKINELSLAINWLLKFQDDTTCDVMTKKFVQETETDWIKVGLSEIEILNSTPWEKWLGEFESYIDKNTIYKTAIHGDFWYTNILIVPNTHEINVIDWENFMIEGNPFFDIMIFIFQFMIRDSSNKVSAFKLDFVQIEKINLLKKWNKELSEHFGLDFKFIVLLRWFLMREIAYSKLFVNGERVNAYVKMLKFLSDKETFF